MAGGYDAGVGCEASYGGYALNAGCNSRQEAQLPQRNSASAAHVRGGGLDPPVHSPSSGYTYACGRIRKPQRTYVKRAVRKAHFKLNRAFKVILIGAARSPEWSVVVMCN